MKIIFLTLLIAFNTFAFTAKVNIPGMVCQMCVQGINKQFDEIVDEKIVFNLEEKYILLKMKEKIKDSDIRKRIRDAGYRAKDISWTK